jgi:medium-chain acyl-[acyl-carrier-protein] hydrolase
MSSEKLHLICFPYAGGDSRIFRGWTAFLSPQIRVYAPCFPGHGERIGEEPVSSIESLVNILVEELLPLTDAPYALYGHSMGGFIAFELARALRRMGKPEPLHLFVAAQRAPHLPYPFPIIYDLTEDQFLKGVRDRYGETIPPAVLNNPDLRRPLLAALRADFTVVETYKYLQETALSCPITVFGGEGDNRVDPAEIKQWRVQTTGAFALNMLPSGHFFLNTERPKLLALIAKSLNPALKVYA